MRFVDNTDPKDEKKLSKCSDPGCKYVGSIMGESEDGNRWCAIHGAGKSDSEPTLRGLPEDLWEQSIEMQRGWLWKHSLALQEANDLLGRVITELRNEAVERVQPELLNELDKDEWWDVVQTCQPQISRQEFELMWSKFQALKEKRKQQ